MLLTSVLGQRLVLPIWVVGQWLLLVLLLKALSLQLVLLTSVVGQRLVLPIWALGQWLLLPTWVVGQWLLLPTWAVGRWLLLLTWVALSLQLVLLVVLLLPWVALSLHLVLRVALSLQLVLLVVLVLQPVALSLPTSVLPTSELVLVAHGPHPGPRHCSTWSAADTGVVQPEAVQESQYMQLDRENSMHGHPAAITTRMHG